MVRQNCFEALRQVHYHDEYEYIWVDCLCIHQTDLDEKSHQVQRMGQIYRHADCVLACIGHDVPGVQDLGDAVSSLRSIRDFDETGKPLSTPSYSTWLEELPDDCIASLTREMNQIATLPYWKRLWIIQEIQLAKKIYLYIGSSRLPWRGLAALFMTMRMKADTKRKNVGAAFQYQLNLEYGVHGNSDKKLCGNGFAGLVDGEDDCTDRRYPLRDALGNLRRTQSSLPHDAIYGLRELIVWPKELGAIRPNYRLSPFHLALQVLWYDRVQICEDVGNEHGHNHIAFAVDVAEKLRLDTDDVELSNRLCERQRPLNYEDAALELAEATTHHQKAHSTEKRCRIHYASYVKRSNLYRLGYGGLGRHVVDLDRREEDEESLCFLGAASECMSEHNMNCEDPSGEFRPLYHGSTVVGWVPQHAEAGDCLALLHQDEAEPGLVLRPVEDSPILKIVGLFVLQRNTDPGSLSFLSKGQELIVHFDHEDLLLFAIQYCQYTSDDLESRARRARVLLKRLSARAARSPSSSYGFIT